MRSFNRFIQFILLLSITGFSPYSPEIKSDQIATPVSNIVKQERSDLLISQIEQLRARISQSKQEYEKFLPKKAYLIISTSDNQVMLMNKDEILHSGRCSTGSFVLLKAPDSRQWLFRTPRGQFKVNVKLKNPSWYRPDWAYIEEGKPIPSLYSPARWQDGVLGKYALGFGPAFMIHGTIYKRFLGLPATHGCVRLDDDDMQIIFHKLSHGCKIFIY
jgi:L,D-transpeptidase ErfK/SrfK